MRAFLAERFGLDARDLDAPQCSISSHLALKADPARFEEQTTHIGWQDDGDGGLLELRDCELCGSTLVREVRP